MSYFNTYEPHALKKLSANEYCLKEHDSFRISKGRWYWNSQGISGADTIDYLQKVKNMNFKEAVVFLSGGHVNSKKIAFVPKEKTLPKVLKELPRANQNNAQVYAYLRGRGIDKDTILDCFNRKILYESKEYNNAVFLGQNSDNTVKYAFVRGTKNRFMYELDGSNKNFNFALDSDIQATTIRAFESSIDLLSDVTLDKLKGIHSSFCHRVSLGGTSSLALIQKLKQFPNIQTIELCLDNDDGGIKGAKHTLKNIEEMFHKKYDIHFKPPQKGKDYNEYLQSTLKELHINKPDKEITR